MPYSREQAKQPKAPREPVIPGGVKPPGGMRVIAPRQSMQDKMVRAREPYNFQRSRMTPNLTPRPPQAGIQPNQLQKAQRDLYQANADYWQAKAKEWDAQVMKRQADMILRQQGGNNGRNS